MNVSTIQTEALHRESRHQRNSGTATDWTEIDLGLRQAALANGHSLVAHSRPLFSRLFVRAHGLSLPQQTRSRLGIIAEPWLMRLGNRSVSDS